MNLQGIAFVVMVTIIILTIGAVFIDIYLALLFQYDNIVFWCLTPFFAVTYILLMISYFRAVCSSSGHPQKSINRQFSTEEISKFIEKTQIIKSHNKERRKRRRIDTDPEEMRQLKEITYCDKCEVVKLPRVHHCKECNRCIERMDHHCPWVGNCVGRNNHKYFILFLFYATLGLGMVWISLAIDGLQGWPLLGKLQSGIETTMVALAGGAALLLFLSIGVLFITQMMMATQNYTTLESFIPGMDSKSPFDKGNTLQNMQQIFGSGCWFLPTNPNLPANVNPWVNNELYQHEIGYKAPEYHGNTTESYK